jgi:predicted DCC family thiol-disulfide oxidoreductase YuxK
VRFLIARDPKARFRFAALQSEAARAACVGHELRATRTQDTVVVIEDGRALERSDAALAIARHLPFPWPLLGAFRALPRGVRDAMYGLVAGNRHRWFGRSEACMVPTPEIRARFLD